MLDSAVKRIYDGLCNQGVYEMRRWIATLFALVWLTACIPAGAASFSKSGAAIKYGGSVFRIGQTSTKWKSKLGSYTRKQNETNGALVSYTYTFKARGVKVSTLYSAKLKKEKIVSVLIVGKSVATSGGLRVGNSRDKMAKLYGKKCTRNGDVYTYKAGGRHLKVKAIGNRVYGIKVY